MSNLNITQTAFTFDDVLLVPNYSQVLPKEVDLTTKLSTKLKLNIPIISSPMDTVTDARMAIAMAQEGGIGIIHKNMSPEEQARRISIVKRHESGIVKEPITINASATIGTLLALTKKRKISGVPVVNDNNKLVGIVTNRDLCFETDLDKPIKAVMTPENRLITIKEGDSIENAKALMHKHRIERILIVNDDFALRGLITVKDLTKNITFPLANKDNSGQLRVGAAVGVGEDSKKRIELLINEGVDLLVVDTAHGHSKGVLEQIQWIKRNYSQVNVIGGNITTSEAALALAACGADGVKVGIGPGSICTTRIVAGVGVPQLTAIADVANALASNKEYSQIAIIADGGIRFSGDIAKALAAGADSVMLGGLLAGSDESPGTIELYQGRSYKTYRGMGSLGAMTDGSADRYFQDENSANSDKLVPEGIEGRVPYKGHLSAILHQLLGGLKSAMGYLGAKDIATLHQTAKFVQITNAGMRESHVHDVQIVKESPNYHIS